MALKLKTNRKPQWVEVLENREKPKSKKNPVLGRFKVLPLTPSEIHSLIEDCQEDKWFYPPKKGKRDSSPIRESVIGSPTSFIIKKAEKTIIDWEDIFAEDDGGNETPVDFSKEMIETLYELNPDIINYVLDKSDEYSNLSAKSEDDESKN